MLFEKIYKSDKTLAKLIWEGKRENTNYQYQNEGGDITRDYIDIKGIVRTYEQLYINKFDNSVKRDKFLERHKLPKITS